MKVLYTPCVSPNAKIEYVFGIDKIKVSYKNEVIIYDFNNVEENKVYDVDASPFVSSVCRKNGELYVVLVNYIEENARPQECFPKEFMPNSVSINESGIQFAEVEPETMENPIDETEDIVTKEEMNQAVAKVVAELTNMMTEMLGGVTNE